MTLLTLHDKDGYLCLDAEECRAAGRALAEQYRDASPFPHIMVEDILDRDVLRWIATHYPALDGEQFFDRAQERFKYQFPPHKIPDGRTCNILAELNSAAFLGFLEEMTGITGLIPDPHFSGGGLHLTRSGGHLSVHADFNVHKKMRLERRLNLLIYLNEDWPDEYGGQLELWDREMARCERAILPLMARAVVFNTTLSSFHGQPDPLACPPNRDRRSIATYYYTALTEATDLPERTTTFQVRPTSGDVSDRRVKMDHFIQDWVPPRLQKIARRLNPFH